MILKVELTIIDVCELLIEFDHDVVCLVCF